MILRRDPKKKRRYGSTVVETVLVILPLLMIVLGIFEFGRMLMCWNLLNNAARTGCRWALVNNLDTNIQADTKTQVTNRMAGMDTSAFTGFSVTVTGTHGGVSTPVNNLVAGDMITVTVSGQFQFMNIIPFLNMGTMTITSSPTMVCEGAT
jgi:Flp pilus assembly protein TadG